MWLCGRSRRISTLLSSPRTPTSLRFPSITPTALYPTSSPSSLFFLAARNNTDSSSKTPRILTNSQSPSLTRVSCPNNTRLFSNQCFVSIAPRLVPPAFSDLCCKKQSPRTRSSPRARRLRVTISAALPLSTCQKHRSIQIESRGISSITPTRSRRRCSSSSALNPPTFGRGRF